MADRQILELNDGTRLTVKRESAKNPKESVQVLPTRRIPLETPKDEDGLMYRVECTTDLVLSLRIPEGRF